MKSITKYFNALPLWGKAITLIIIAIIIYIAYRKLMIYLQGLKNESLINSTENSGGVTIDLGAKAVEIYNAFYNYMYGLAEDETTAINTIKSVPTNLIPKLQTLYFSLYAKNLKEDFIKYTDYTQVSNKFV